MLQIRQTVPWKTWPKTQKSAGSIGTTAFFGPWSIIYQWQMLKKLRVCPHLLLENNWLLKMAQIGQMVPHRKLKKVPGVLVPQQFLVLGPSFTNGKCSKKSRACPFLFWKCHICQIALDRASGNSKKHASDFLKKWGLLVPKWFYVLKASFTTHISSKKSRACLHTCLEETKFVKSGQIGQVVTQTACPQTLLSAQFHFPFKKLGSVNNMEGPGWHYFHSPGPHHLG